jgi:hypothetical protein
MNRKSKIRDADKASLDDFLEVYKDWDNIIFGVGWVEELNSTLSYILIWVSLWFTQPTKIDFIGIIWYFILHAADWQKKG